MIVWRHLRRGRADGAATAAQAAVTAAAEAAASALAADDAADHVAEAADEAERGGIAAQPGDTARLAHAADVADHAAWIAAAAAADAELAAGAAVAAAQGAHGSRGAGAAELAEEAAHIGRVAAIAAQAAATQATSVAEDLAMSEERVEAGGVDLSAIEDRLRQVTPGPWRRHGCDVWADGNAATPLLMTPPERDSSGEARRQADRNAEFIAHSVEDVRALIDELRSRHAEGRRPPSHRHSCAP